MEHRCVGRSKVSLDVVIRDKRGLIWQGRVRDVNREGMLIQTDSQGIQKGEMLDIELSSGCCMRGWVVHTGDNGIGVLLVSPHRRRDGRAYSASASFQHMSEMPGR